MSYKIDDIEGVGPAFLAKLTAAGISNTRDLLNACCTKRGRAEMAEETGISEKLLLSWSNMADLMRIKGVGKQYAELLEAAGVDTVKELRNRKPENLTTKMKEVNAQKRLTRATPSATQVTAWVRQAKTLKPAISY